MPSSRRLPSPENPRTGRVTFAAGIAIGDEIHHYELEMVFTNRKGVTYGGLGKRRQPVRFEVARLRPKPKGEHLLFAKAIYAEGVDAGEFPYVRDLVHNRVNWVKGCPGDTSAFGSTITDALTRPGQFASVLDKGPKFRELEEELDRRSGPCQYTTAPRAASAARARLVNAAIDTEAVGDGKSHPYLYFRSDKDRPSPRAWNRHGAIPEATSTGGFAVAHRTSNPMGRHHDHAGGAGGRTMTIRTTAARALSGDPSRRRGLPPRDLPSPGRPPRPPGRAGHALDRISILPPGRRNDGTGTVPRIGPVSVGPHRTAGTGRDKSVSPTDGDQDQSVGSTALAPTATGVSIRVDAVGLTSTPDYPDGFRWTQTIVTNVRRGASLLAAPVSYVDPDPNDDAKPFYWTDAEEARRLGVFTDAPSRKPRSGGTVVWDAVLSLNGVSGHDLTRFDSMTYGFSVDSAGAVTSRGPSSSGGVADHLATLRSSFPGWTFG